MSQMHHETFEKMKQYFNVEYCLDLPKPSEIMFDNLPKLIIMDDLAQKMLSSPFMEDLFSQHSRHNSCSVIFTSQNYFSNSKSKIIIRNCNYKVVFQSPADLVLLRNIACQIKPDDANFLIKIFELLDQTYPTVSHKYILIDGEPKSFMKLFRTRTNIFPNSSGRIEPICFY